MLLFHHLLANHSISNEPIENERNTALRLIYSIQIDLFVFFSHFSMSRRKQTHPKSFKGDEVHLFLPDELHYDREVTFRIDKTGINLIFSFS